MGPSSHLSSEVSLKEGLTRELDVGPSSHLSSEVSLKEVVDGPQPGAVVLEGSLVADGEGAEVGHQAAQEVYDSGYLSILGWERKRERPSE